MVKNSLLEMYSKYNNLSRRFYAGKYKDKIKTRLDFYAQEGNSVEYFKNQRALEKLIQIEQGLENVFLQQQTPVYWASQNFGWQSCYKRADQVLYKQSVSKEDCVVEEFYSSNDMLYEKVVEELNKAFPEEEWTVGEIPLYHWDILNYPGYDADEEDYSYWECQPNVKKMDGYYYEFSHKNTKCLYQRPVAEKLEGCIDNIDQLANTSRMVESNKQAYIIDDNALMDTECSGGYSLHLDIEFIEGVNETFYGHKYTPQEKVMNETIVQELDKKAVDLDIVKIIHERLDNLSKCLDIVIANNNLGNLINVKNLDDNTVENIME